MTILKNATPWYVYGFGAVVGVILAGLIKSALSSAPAESPAVCPSEPDDAWIQRRLSYFEQTCGPVPFEVKIWKRPGDEGLEGSCGRPEKIKKISLPPQGGPLRGGIAPINKEL